MPVVTQAVSQTTPYGAILLHDKKIMVVSASRGEHRLLAAGDQSGSQSHHSEVDPRVVVSMRSGVSGPTRATYTLLITPEEMDQAVAQHSLAGHSGGIATRSSCPLRQRTMMGRCAYPRFSKRRTCPMSLKPVKHFIGRAKVVTI